MSDIAHLGPVEMLHARGSSESLRFFIEMLGMEIEAPGRTSRVYLRGWGDYQPWSLKLTEATTPGTRHPRPARLEPAGAGAPGRARSAKAAWASGGPRATAARGAELPLPRSRRAPVRALLRDPSATCRPRAPAPFRSNVPQRYTGRGAAVKRLDHINLLAADVAREPRVLRRRLGYRLYERIELDDGSETGAWMSADDRRARAHLHQGRARSARAVAPRSAVGRHARGMPACSRHLARRRNRDRGSAFEARDRPGFLPLRHRARRQPHRGHDRRALRLRPRRAVVVWTEAERARGQAWG